jgi:hypothetical protein
MRPAQVFEVQQNALRVLQLIELLSVLILYLLDPEPVCYADGVSVGRCDGRSPAPSGASARRAIFQSFSLKRGAAGYNARARYDRKRKPLLWSLGRLFFTFWELFCGLAGC